MGETAELNWIQFKKLRDGNIPQNRIVANFVMISS
jgi:hypothetical protein